MERDWQDYKALHSGVAGARDAFEKTCLKLFKAKFPAKTVKGVAVKQGDGGIDVFAGELGIEPISVFQCKFFIENFVGSQKTQIKDSFDTAINSPIYKMSDWNLCIPRELDIENQAWWTKWKKSMETLHNIPIKLYDGNDLINELKIFKLYNEEFKIEEKLQLDRIEKAVSAKIEKQKTILEKLYIDVKDWFTVVGYTFEPFEQLDGSTFQFIINIKTRRSFDRIFILGTCDEIDLHHLGIIKTAVKDQNCIEGWLIPYSRISSALKEELSKNPSKIFCYTLDELIDKDIDFTEYFEWVKKEVSDKGIDKKYIQLACKKDSINPKTKEKIDPPSIYDENNGFIDGYLDTWLDDPNKKHISVLGEFGTGKTWFSLHYTWYLLEKYLNDKAKGVKQSRLPIYIPLRDYAKAVTLESLFSDFFFRKYNSPIPGYKAFEMLNRMGKFLIIFDGFDEMADKVDKQKMVNNFWELAKIASIDNTKVILTSRNEHFPQSHEGRSILNAELAASITNLTGESPQFEVVELLKLNLKQIKKILSLNTNPDIIKKIIKNKALLDLAARPLMIELIVDAIPDIEKGKDIDLSRIYLYAVSKKMRKDIKEERTFTSMAEKLFFMCEISWEMLSNEKMSINYKEFPDRIRNLFGSVVQEQKDLDHWQYDMMGQTLLIRNDDGDYKPAHKSLLEFFVAYKFAAELGFLSEDFIEIARENKNVNQEVEPQNYSWQDYFTLTSQKESISPLKNFSNSQISVIIENFGKIPLSKAVIDLIINMIPLKEGNIQNSLLNLLNYCRNKKREEINYLSNNIIALLASYKFNFFKGLDLSNLTLTNFKIPRENSSDSQRGYIDLSDCNLMSSILINCNFGNSLNNSWMSKDITESNFLNTNFRNAQLDKFNFPTNQISSLNYHTQTKRIILSSPFDIVILNEDFFVIKRIITSAWTSLLLPNKQYLISRDLFSISIRDALNYDLVKEIKNPNMSLSVSTNDCFQCSTDSNFLFISQGSKIHIMDLIEEKEFKSIECDEYISEISINSDNKYLLSYSKYQLVIWDWKKAEKIYHRKEKEVNKNQIIYQAASFHPTENRIFVVCINNRVKIYDLEKTNFIFEFDFKNANKITFLKEKSLMFISNGNTIGVYDSLTFKEITVVKLIEDFAKDFELFREEIYLDGYRNFFVELINDKIFLFYNFGNRSVVKYDLEKKKVVNKYLHMVDFNGSDFTGAKGLTKAMAEQLKKNGAIIKIEAYE